MRSWESHFLGKVPDYFLGVDLAPEISLRLCESEVKLRSQGFIVFDVGSFLAPAAIALEILASRSWSTGGCRQRVP